VGDDAGPPGISDDRARGRSLAQEAAAVATRSADGRIERQATSLLGHHT
jgi:hypothetical protein